jgi:hypothetical protein
MKGGLLPQLLFFLSISELLHPLKWTWPLRACFLLAGVDWIIWGIWGIGLLILIIWIIRPVQEYRILIRAKRQDRDSAA